MTDEKATASVRQDSFPLPAEHLNIAEQSIHTSRESQEEVNQSADEDQKNNFKSADSSEEEDQFQCQVFYSDDEIEDTLEH